MTYPDPDKTTPMNTSVDRTATIIIVLSPFPKLGPIVVIVTFSVTTDVGLGVDVLTVVVVSTVVVCVDRTSVVVAKVEVKGMTVVCLDVTVVITTVVVRTVVVLVPPLVEVADSVGQGGIKQGLSSP